MSMPIIILLQVIVLAYALVAGVFLAFSDFIMRALARTSGSGGVEAMQVINREVFRWVFMALFLGLAPVSLGLVAYGSLVLGGGTGTLLVAAGLVYLLGCFAVTVFGNVPMNNALADLPATESAAHNYWSGTYVPRWTRFNTIRALAALVSAGLLMSALIWVGE